MYSGITGEEFAADIYIGVVYYQRLRHMVLDKFQVRTTGPIDPLTRQPVKVCASIVKVTLRTSTHSDQRKLLCLFVIHGQGRKRAGGIRFGEMERDALIAHGTSFLLQDRLMNCSDYSTAWVCRTCGSLISLGYDNVSLGSTVLGVESVAKPTGPGGEYCRVCRAVAEEEDRLVRQSLANGKTGEFFVTGDVRVSIPSTNFLAPTSKGGDLDVVAVPYVFRYLCAELAAMGIAVSVAVE